LTNKTIAFGSNTFSGTLGTTNGGTGLSSFTSGGVVYASSTSALATGSALTFDGANLLVGGSSVYGATITSYASASRSGGLGIRNSAGTAAGGIYTGAAGSGSGSTDMYVEGAGLLGFITGGTTQLTLTSSSLYTASGINVGIGTSSPAYKLDAISTGNTQVARFRTGGSGTSDIVAFARDDSAVRAAINYNGTDGGISLWTSTNHLLAFGTNGTRQAILDTSGNLGLGVTPSAWGSANKVFQVVNGAVWSPGGADTRFSTNQYRASDGSRVYIVNGYAQEYVQTSGQHLWNIAASGTAGNPISFTQAMTLSAAGFLGIGETSPSVALSIKGATADSATIQLKQTASSGQDYRITSRDDGSFRIQSDTAAAERLRIDSSGNLLVGTTNAYGKFYVFSTSNSSAMVYAETSGASYNGSNIYSVLTGAGNNNTTARLFSGYNVTNGDVFYVYGNGNVVNYNNSYGALSDIKLKENIVDASPKLADLMQVKVRSYNMIGDTTKQLGVVAQELETVFPSMIDKSPDRDVRGNDLGTTTKAVKYSVFVPMLIKAMQEQQAMIESLRQRLSAANL
jgi:hypothetical protein